MKRKIDDAIYARKTDKPEDALSILFDLLKVNPKDPIVNYQIAWTYDFMSKESDAVSFYEVAINNGLVGEDRNGALLGLGSTYRCLGEYEKSKDCFDSAIKEFPSDRSFQVFQALTLYNLGKPKEAIGLLLNQLLDTTSDARIKLYEKALRFYSDKLDQTWK